ncbi:xanthine dehydrogenase molybdopterin binding subunit [Anaeromyxobacter diazotrophicus]|uniref:Xanthine dehydrogenase molybdopterin binding subunit n=1 Tax=Anaeromyxobacter diazotrophicus TaxID=2590199 RepID=A0A7I9VR78_9BACT|nr:xanthine dehydrogenase molybdopterin binding subunit [Anaeromyxobacter diazotrophicus]GEJ58915.1 xanthine dehydrogenase molybdopterin binding subunit [Anaeromyxobacter diazotrophicus]
MRRARESRPEAAGAVGAPLGHDSARRHVTGEARYVDDLPEPRDLLHAFLRLSERAHARVTRLDVTGVAAAPGVAAVLTARDLPAENDIGPVLPGDKVFADGLVEYWGQSLFAVAAETLDQARAAASRAGIAYEDLPAVLTVEEALARRSFVLPTQVLRRGASAAARARAPHRLSGRLAIGGQEHFYLEGQVAMALPREGGTFLVHSSTQHPSEVQHLVAKVLGIPASAVTVEVRRMGGAFGGKETQAAPVACVAALLAWRTGRPVKLRLDRDDDMIFTGKRHDFLAEYEVGFDGEGRIRGLDLTLASRCGFSPDLSGAINDRAMLHADNCYHLQDVTITSHRCKTNTVSNTAFRGFGGPQGMMAIEQIVDEIARALALDPLEVRRRNFYGRGERDETPYGMKVEDHLLPELVAELERSSDYPARRRAIARFNAQSPWQKRGIALTPVKFGISFTATEMNQAGALVHVYTDGSVHLNHGGTEMGQGLFIKVAQVVADELGVGVDRVQITATTTDQVPNTSPTAASSGSDLNGQAARAAARTIKKRLAACAAAALGGKPEEVVFAGGQARLGRRALGFAELAALAHRERVSLSATGYYRTPKLHYDRRRQRGRPFYYFAWGAAVAEVQIDTLTGEYRVLRADLLHDCGSSINPAVDLGQVEGGFVQGMGWLTTEELWWDAAGRLGTHAPSTYKIPACGDVPEDFRVTLLHAPNREASVHRSKAVGEPPLMLGISVFHALKDAVAAVGDHRLSPRLDAPATPERVLLAVEELRARRAPAELEEAAE